jgi:hypothetical protein
MKRIFTLMIMAAALVAGGLNAQSPKELKQQAKREREQSEKRAEEREKQAERERQEQKKQAKHERQERRREARQEAYLAQQQWRAEHPAEAAYQDMVAQQQAAQLFNFGMNLLFPPKVTCTSYAYGWTVQTVCR